MEVLREVEQLAQGHAVEQSWTGTQVFLQITLGWVRG